MPTINEIKKEHSDEWVLVEVLAEDDLGRTVEARLIAHSKNRDEIYRAMLKNRHKYTQQFYTGQIPQKGYAAAFKANDQNGEQLLQQWLANPVEVGPTDSLKEHDVVH